MFRWFGFQFFWGASPHTVSYVSFAARVFGHRQAVRSLAVPRGLSVCGWLRICITLHCPPLDQRRKSIKCHCFRVRRARHKYQSAEKCRIPEQMDKGVKALDRSKSTSSHNRNSPAIVDTDTEYRSHSGAQSVLNYVFNGQKIALFY